MESQSITALKRLPDVIQKKAILRYNEVAWKKDDFIDVVNAACKIPMAIVGGQVQYYFPNEATCELYWLSYDPIARLAGEDWILYCQRTAQECISKFNNLVGSVDIEKDAINSFDYIKNSYNKGVSISDYQIFILYFDDSETEAYLRNNSN